jgi:hypothetical protein
MRAQLPPESVGLSLPALPGQFGQPAVPVEARPLKARTGHQVPQSVCGVVSGEPCEGCRCFEER